MATVAATSSGIGGKEKKNRAQYTINNPLKPPRATTRSARDLHEAIHNESINLNAAFQLDVVWNDIKQIELVDSIFRNFYVPPIIFASKTREDGSETKICIDGKQRLMSIRKFMDGLIPHKDPKTSKKWWYTDISGNSRTPKRILPEYLKKVFANKQIVCVEYQDITEDDQCEIFQRAHIGRALTPAEELEVVATAGIPAPSLASSSFPSLRLSVAFSALALSSVAGLLFQLITN